MTREEEIKNAIDTIIPILPSENGRTYEQALMATGLEEGVKWADEHPYWRPSTEHPQMDEEVIALVGEYNAIYFAHIVNKDIAIDYDGWNIPDVRGWIPCPKIEED